MEYIKTIYIKYKDVIPYLFFGVCTTIVNVVVYWAVAYILKLSTIPATVIAWFVAVIFAYYTNRKWVFRSKANTVREIMKEMISFLGCRLATGIIDGLIMWLFVDLLSFYDIIVKFVANVLVIVLNYVASKVIIFREGKV